MLVSDDLYSCPAGDVLNSPSILVEVNKEFEKLFKIKVVLHENKSNYISSVHHCNSVMPCTHEV